MYILYYVHTMCILHLEKLKICNHMSSNTELMLVRKAVRYWSCPLSRSRGRIIPCRPHMPKWAQTCEKSLPHVGLESTSSRFKGLTLYQLIHGSSWLYTVYLRNLNEVRICGLQPIKMLHSSRLYRQAAQPYLYDKTVGLIYSEYISMYADIVVE